MSEPTQEADREGLFCYNLPNLPKVWDSTMFGLLKECPRKFQYVILEGWQPRGFAAHLAFGIAYHKALEIFDHHRSAGMGYDEAQIEAVKFCMSYGERKPDGTFTAYDSFFTNEPNKVRHTLVRSVIWYLEEFRNDTLTTVQRRDGTPAVELSFKLNLQLQSPDGDPFALAGHLDRLVEDDSGHLWFLDRKTTKNEINARYWNQFNPNNQMSLYYFATQSILHKPARGGIIDAVQIGVTFSRYRRNTIYMTRGQQEEWLADTNIYLNLAQSFALNDYWPKNDKSCGNYGGCPFQVICSRDPKVRSEFIKHEGFYKRHWNPLENR